VSVHGFIEIFEQQLMLEPQDASHVGCEGKNVTKGKVNAKLASTLD